MWSDSHHLLQPWRDAFNALPYEVRHIACATSIGTQLQGLAFERKRLAAAYRKSLADISAHEKNLVRYLKQEFPEMTTTQHDGEKE